jgi:hypothetical protein
MGPSFVQRPFVPVVHWSSRVQPVGSWPPKVQSPGAGVVWHCASFGRWLTGTSPPPPLDELDPPLELELPPELVLEPPPELPPELLEVLELEEEPPPSPPPSVPT